jgi:uncharacterized membrane protein (UPF0127 family)
LFLPAFLFSAEIQRLCIKDICLEIEVAASGQTRQKGLMFRQELKPGKGMLFNFTDEAFHRFWMKNMNFPLDLIWVNKEKVIVDVTKNAQPCDDSCPTFTSGEKAFYVLEVNAGFVEQHKVRIGERLVF